MDLSVTTTSMSSLNHVLDVLEPRTNNTSTYSTLEMIVMCVSVTIIWFLVVVGNALVIVAIMTDRHLKGVQHWFLGSLAFADLMLGILVLPLSLVKEALGYWIFGGIPCTVWLATDVLLSTASIMNLCLISLDRYCSIKFPLSYTQSRTPRRAGLMIALVWLISAAICLPPLMGWRKPQPDRYVCELTTDIGYVFYSTIGSFYIPLIIIIVVYASVFYEARKRLHNRPGGGGSCAVPLKHKCTPPPQLSVGPSADPSIGLPTSNQSTTKNDFPQNNDNETQSYCQSELGNLCASTAASGNGDTMETNATSLDQTNPSLGHSFLNRFRKTMRSHGTKWRRGERTTLSFAEQKRRLARHRERRATLVLGIVLGAFILCWFPFFTTYIIDIFCKCVDQVLFKFFFWLGYCNSALNPIIYTVFNRDFRKAFKKLLSCTKYS